MRVAASCKGLYYIQGKYFNDVFILKLRGIRHVMFMHVDATKSLSSAGECCSCKDYSVLIVNLRDSQLTYIVLQ